MKNNSVSLFIPFFLDSAEFWTLQQLRCIPRRPLERFLTQTGCYAC